MRTIDIAVNLFSRYEQVREVNHYYGLLAIFALAKIADETGDAITMQQAMRHLNRYPDTMRHPRYNFEAYRAGGNGQAYLLMRGKNEAKAEVVRAYAEETLRAPADDQGILIMPGRPEKKQIWIDVVTAVSPYMLYAGLYFDEPRYIDFALNQCFAMYDAFEDPENHLLHQSRGFIDGDITALSTDHWSRGNGWGIIGLAEILQYLPRTDARYAEAERRFIRHCEAMLPYQTENGLWRQEIPDPLAWEESSGTGLILHSYGVGIRLGILDSEKFGPAFRRGLEGLVRHCINADFSTEKSCIGCLCPGSGPDKGTPKAYIVDKHAHRNEPHSFAPIMLTLLEAHMSGITEVAWDKQ